MAKEPVSHPQQDIISVSHLLRKLSDNWVIKCSHLKPKLPNRKIPTFPTPSTPFSHSNDSNHVS
jgi:hypothetical protein